jgi:hypothetical protein
LVRFRHGLPFTRVLAFRCRTRHRDGQVSTLIPDDVPS